MHERSWSAVPIVAEPPTDSGTGDGRRFFEVPESGWHTLFAWAVGPEHMVRCLDVRPPEPVHVVYESKGERTVRVEERTRGDRSAVDGGIHDYLTDARVPSQPCGYRWFIELPDGIDDADQFFALFGPALMDLPPGPRPRREREAMIAVAKTLYPAVPQESSRESVGDGSG
ncbi:DUF5956 family protein [Nocardiopsis tropica]|uniref:DUF5956 family protein n=1 Tax=Nocardiopsis tropica TaxID=109330 RepID=A0ABV2A2J2_9ACTN